MKHLFAIFFIIFSYQCLGRDIPYQYLGTVPLKAPTRMTACAGDLWIYSVSEKSLFQYRKDSALPILVKKYSLEPIEFFHNVQAIGCDKSTDKEKILVAISYGEKSSPFLYVMEKSKFLRKSPLPERSVARDLFCDDSSCWLLQNKLYSTNDFKKWKEEVLPPSKKILNNRLQPKLNPFAHVPDQYTLAQTRYTRLKRAKGSNFFVLDGARSQMISTNFGDSTNKWGKWGGREGQMMYPKAFDFLFSKEVVVIADAGLKHLFLFAVNGNYLGKIGSSEDDKRLQYPIDVYTQKSKIYVSDYFGNSIHVYQIDSSLDQVKNIPEPQTVADRLHENLFRLPFVMKSFDKTSCFNCHDGTEVDSQFKFMNYKHHHPINVEVNKDVVEKGEIPLKQGKYLTCASCHDQHHDGILGKGVDQSGKEVEEKLANLRMSFKDLCVSCHADNLDPQFNHIDLNLHFASKKVSKKVKVVSCSQCHEKMHASNEKLLRLSPNNLCIECHSRRQIPVNHALGMQKNGDYVKCIDCHALHGSKSDQSFARHTTGPKERDCFNCHDDIEDHFKGNPHFRKLQSKEAKHWKGPTGHCLNCHRPHRPKILVRRMCLNCHADMNTRHKNIDPVEDTNRAETLCFEKNRITCITCHDPHRVFDGKMLKDTGPILHFCASCHGKKTQKLYDNYHEK